MSNDNFRVRFNSHDWYSENPSHLDPPLPVVSAAEDVPQVPVIRVWGTTDSGPSGKHEKVLLHIHGAFPYIYIEYPGPYKSDAGEEKFGADSVKYWVTKLRVLLDQVLNASFSKGKVREDGKIKQYVATIAVVKGVPFYGYHAGWRLYCKVYLYNPHHVNRLTRLLAVMKQKFQPYEAHIGYVHQFMMDYDINGCGYVNMEKSKVFYRRIHTENEDEDNPNPTQYGINSNQILPDAKFPPHSYAGWEIDIQARDILNRLSIAPRPIHQSFENEIKGIPEAGNRLLHSLDELWRAHGSYTQASSNELEYSVSSATPPPRTEWLQEPEYREQVLELIEQERRHPANSRPQNIPRTIPFDECFPTAFDSVEYLDSYYGRSAEAQNDVSLQFWDIEDDAFDLNLSDLQEIEEDIDRSETDEEESSELGEPGDHDGALADDADEIHDEELELEEDETMQEYPEIIRTSGQGGTITLEGDEDDESDVISHSPSPRFTATTPQLETLIHRKKRKLSSSDTDSSGYDSDPFVELKDEPLVNKRHPSIAKTQLSRTPEPKKDSLGIDLDKFPESQSIYPLRNPSRSPTIPITPVLFSEPRQKAAGQAERRVQFSFPEPEADSSLVQHEGVPVASSKISSSAPDTNLSENTVPSHSEISFNFGKLVCQTFDIESSVGLVTLCDTPPSVAETIDSLPGGESVVYPNAFFSDPSDVPENPQEYGGVTYNPQASDITNLPEFNPLDDATSGLAIPRIEPEDEGDENLPRPTWVAITEVAPSRGEIRTWMDSEPRSKQPRACIKQIPVEFSQIEGPTQKNRYGFKYSQVKKVAEQKTRNTDDMTILSLEIHVNTRGALVPDPKKDPLACIFWCMQSAGDDDQYEAGILAIGEHQDLEKLERCCNAHVHVVPAEPDLIDSLIKLVKDLDPDILAGFEVHSNSWGYIMERAAEVNGLRLTEELSRVRVHSRGRIGRDADRWGYKKAAAIRVTGRHIINVWRAMRGELNLTSYKLESIVFHLLNRRIPHYAFKDLTRWYKSDTPSNLARVLKYFILRTRLNLEILEKQEYVTRISEHARLIGCDFYTVFSRGSQIKVESLMFRIAKPESFLMISPSKKQVGRQNAIECKPLIMEPQSGFYTSPILVLDFQSLYPSIMIAYNYCYSTCLGRIGGWSKSTKLGVRDYYRPLGMLGYSAEHLNIAPNGMIYVNQQIRKSLLAKMLSEILDTRIMVKTRMKDDVDKDLRKRLNSWQLALKLIANVTYGYASATFSGRMPCVEIADSIVQTGRETLEKLSAIELIHSEERWGAEVVYGDTDSLFVHLKGKNKAQAFDIGEEIAARVTAMNPKPIKLKFEKVYHPSVLLAMKRYVGHKYEYRAQAVPDFDAKGIETVRRDGTPAIQKIVEKSLTILFRTSDISQVKAYCTRQWGKIMKEKVSIQDFCFAKEVRLGSYSEGAPPQPGAKLAAERMAKDPRNEPQYGERYPYIVVAGSPDQSVTDRSVEVDWLLHSDRLALDSSYYIRRKIIPPLERIFSLVGANVLSWYQQMPKYQPLRKVIRENNRGAEEEEVRAATLEMFADQDSPACPICKTSNDETSGICDDCITRRDESLYEIERRLGDVGRRYNHLQEICRSCAGLSWPEEVLCNSTDCPVFYSRVREETRLKSQEQSAQPILLALKTTPPESESEGDHSHIIVDDSTREDEDSREESDVDEDWDVFD